MADNVLTAFRPPHHTVVPHVIQLQNVDPPNVDGELEHGRSIFKVAAGPCITMLIPTAAHVPLVTAAQVPPATAAQFPLATAAQADLENDSEMWNMFLDEVKEEDNRFTDAWKDDASSIVTFVSHNLLGPCVHLSDKLQDRSFLRNCWRIHH
jgi:hypothetical protein